MKHNENENNANVTRRSVMRLAWGLYRDPANDLTCFALALKCAWSMHKEYMNALYTESGVQAYYDCYKVAVAYLKRGGGKNRVHADGTDTWFDTRDVCETFLKDPDSIYIVCHTAWGINAGRVRAGKAPREIWSFIGHVAEREYMRETGVHRLYRDVVNADGITERKRIRVRPTVSESALTRKNADGQEFNLLETAQYAVTDEHADLIYGEIVNTCARDDTDRVILKLRRAGVKSKEIAEFIGISAPAVTKRLNRMFETYKKVNA